MNLFDRREGDCERCPATLEADTRCSDLEDLLRRALGGTGRILRSELGDPLIQRLRFILHWLAASLR